jgi:hypothetical protein
MMLIFGICFFVLSLISLSSDSITDMTW